MASTLEKIQEHSSIEEKEFNSVSKLMFESFKIGRKHKVENRKTITKKEELINSFTHFLEKYLELQFFNSKKDKLEIINFIDKMNMQKELLELKKGDMNISDIQIAGKRLGLKSQSAFKLKK